MPQISVYFSPRGLSTNLLLSLKFKCFFCARSKRLTLNLSNASLRVVGFTYVRWQVNTMVLNNNLGQNIAGKFTKISEAGFCMECFTVFITFWENFPPLIFVNLSAVFVQDCCLIPLHWQYFYNHVLRIPFAFAYIDCERKVHVEMLLRHLSSLGVAGLTHQCRARYCQRNCSVELQSKFTSKIII